MSNRLRRLFFALPLTLACLIAGRGAAWAANPVDATITVTPDASLSLTINPSTYDFKTISVNTSTNSATAVTLKNTGQVSVAVSKAITNQSTPPAWTAGSSAGYDTYVLYCATGAVRPSLNDFTPTTVFGAQSASTPLTGSMGISPVLPPTGVGQSVDLWFRLDMPTSVSSQTSRSITVEFTATAQ